MITRVKFKENGCHIHDDCFTCPLPDCMVDCRSRAERHTTLQAERARVLKLHRQGLVATEIAECTGKSLRTVQRDLAWSKARE